MLIVQLINSLRHAQPGTECMERAEISLLCFLIVSRSREIGGEELNKVEILSSWRRSGQEFWVVSSKKCFFNEIMFYSLLRLSVRARRPLREHPRVLQVRLPPRVHRAPLRGERERVRIVPLPERGNLHRRERRIPMHLHAG